MTDVIQTPDPPFYPDDRDYPDDREWHNVPGPSYQALLDTDRYEVPAHLR